ncbi:MAG: hypothetical protein USCAAHI_02652 [Beijerinckiaceae bacterium]|nr:MAG: hypothetical protein USCAAHI_02652 [Beijerinckiaceae bacterium]
MGRQGARDAKLESDGKADKIEGKVQRFVNLYGTNCLQSVQRTRLPFTGAFACRGHQKVHFSERNLGVDGNNPRRRLCRIFFFAYRFFMQYKAVFVDVI